MTFSIWVPGEPVPQPRQRHKLNLPSGDKIAAHLPGKHATIKGRLQQMTVKSFRQWLIVQSIVGNYTPASHPVNAWKQAIRTEWVIKFGNTPIANEENSKPPRLTPIGMSLLFIRKRPQNITRKTKPNPRLWDSAKVGDPDNLEKAVMDALSGIAYKDDCQISALVAERFVSEPDEASGVIIKIWELDPGTATGKIERPESIPRQGVKA